MHLGTLCVGVTAPDVEITIVRSIGLANLPEDGRVRPDDRGGRCLVLQNIKSSAAILTRIMHEPGGSSSFFFVDMGIACILYGDRELMECVEHHSQRMGSNNAMQTMESILELGKCHCLVVSRNGKPTVPDSVRIQEASSPAAELHSGARTST